MAHGTKINGTIYGIIGGKTKINGTSYGISKGRTKVNGTGYDVSFAPPVFTVRVSAGGSINIEIPYSFESGMTWNDFLTGSTDYRKAYYNNTTSGLGDMAHGFSCPSGSIRGFLTVGCQLQEPSNYPEQLNVPDYSLGSGDYLYGGEIADPNGNTVSLYDEIITSAVYYGMYFRP